MNKLTDKQELFCKEYIISLNATDAARKAGYTGNDNTLSVMAFENLRKPNLQARISELMRERNERLEVTADKVIQELAKIGFAKSETDLEGWELDAKDKTKALEMLARHTGAFNADESGKGVINVTIGGNKK